MKTRPTRVEKIVREYARRAGKGIQVKPHEELFPEDRFGFGGFIAVHPKTRKDSLHVGVYPTFTQVLAGTKGEVFRSTIHPELKGWTIRSSIPSGQNGIKVINALRLLHTLLEKHADKPPN